MAPPAAPREDLVIEREVFGVHVNEARHQLKTEVHQGKLLITIAGDTEEVELPEDAYTDDAIATYRHKKLQVRRRNSTG
jgi:hypothetical protein